jgi:hypothetical protein
MSAPTRRSVVRAGVWTVPVVVTAAAAPAFAGSGTTCPVTIDLNGQACEQPCGGKKHAYRVSLTTHNSSTSNKTVTLTSFTFATGSTTVSPASFVAAHGTSTHVVVVTSTTAASHDATIVYAVDGHTYTATVHFSSFKSC